MSGRITIGERYRKYLARWGFKQIGEEEFKGSNFAAEKRMQGEQ